MTLEKWYENPGNHARLNVILQDPVLKEALALVRDEATQKEDGIELVFANRNAADAAFALSCIHSMQAGMNRVFTRLDKLSKPQKAKKVLKEPFEHVTETITA
jgi:hypothetical protein